MQVKLITQDEDLIQTGKCFAFLVVRFEIIRIYRDYSALTSVIQKKRMKHTKYTETTRP